jgi:hypothetical protein
MAETLFDQNAWFSPANEIHDGATRSTASSGWEIDPVRRQN